MDHVSKGTLKMPLPKVVETLLDPKAYPNRPQDVQLVQTHISYLLLAGDLVYKVKKPVNLGFLDFSTPAKRRHFCEEEVRLNRRLCPTVYLGVVPVVARDGGFAVEGDGKPVDWAVKMTRLYGDRMMDRLVTRGQATPEMLMRVAQVLARFHAEADAGPEVAKWGTGETIKANTQENFSQAEPFVEMVVTRDRFDFIQQYTRRFLASGAAFLARRVETGRIREGHGDMHLANICYTDQPYIYDCIEFNERFRCGDVAGEVAFLAMDLEYRGRPDLAHVFVDAYVEASQDSDMYELLDFYKCYRAFVRAKVRCFRLDEPETSDEVKQSNLDEARHYFDLAYRYAGGRERPGLVVMHGLSGSGKSRLADALSEQLDLVLIRSDVVRKHLGGMAPAERRRETYGAGIYDDETTERTYRTMADDATRLLSSGHSVLLDATFLARKHRDLARSVAVAADARFVLVECVAPEEKTRRRLAGRAGDRTAVSDAGWGIYLQQKRRLEPPDEVDVSQRVTFDTSLDEEAHMVGVVAAKLGERARATQRGG